ncbi:hypothetical protein F4604DRAFT_1675020 [Suillus subluteus]|nr:hypothetical protein F4604DRAFT_1675020 [Suillus subluteus]
MTDMVLCTKADCCNLKQGTQPRKANRNCTRRYCKQCFAAQQHIIPLLSTIDPTSTQLDHPPVTTTQSLPAASQVYAWPLDANYAWNYVLSHQQTLVAEQRFQANQNLSIMIRNMIDVVLWLKNNDPPHLVRLTCTTPGKFVPGDHPLLMRFDLRDYIAVYCSDQHAWIEQDIKTPLLSPPNSTILLCSINLTDNNMLLGFPERVLSLSRTAAAVQSPSKRSFSATGMHLSRLDGITSPLKRQRNTSTNNPTSPVLVSLQSPTPLPLTKSPSPTVMSPLSLTAGDSDTSPVLVPAPAIIQPNVFATVPPGYSPAGQWNTLLAEIKANAASLTGSNGLGSISNSDVKCHMLPPSSLPVDPSVTDTGFQLPTDLTATTNSDLPDLTSYPQIDPFSAWLNDTSHVDYSFIEPDDQTLPSLPPF